MQSFVSEREKKFIEEFESCKDWEERYKQIIRRGKNLPELGEVFKIDANKVKGCQSQVWLVPDLTPEKTLRFKADSDALIVRGLVSILVEFYDNLSPQLIIETNPDFLNQLGFASNLSPSRANGLNSMIKQIKYYGLAYQSLLERS